MDSVHGLRAHQAAFHNESFDYLGISPHLSNAVLRQRIEDRLVALVTSQLDVHGRCHVLDVGGGHGTFAEAAVATGASVTITEMSPASAAWLRERFRHNPQVVVLDDDGDLVGELPERFDIIAYISVLHHIPDYVAHVSLALDHLSPGGALVSYQDPLLYSRCSHVNRLLDRGSYYAWRATKGDLKRGVRTRIRRAKGVYEDRPEDMAEYHVVRDGVDELALVRMLHPRFSRVTVDRYWSTQSLTLARALSPLRLVNTFGLTATGYHVLVEAKGSAD